MARRFGRVLTREGEMREFGRFIQGEFEDRGDWLEVADKETGEPCGRVRASGPEELERAIAGAVEAFPGLSALSTSERTDLLGRLKRVFPDMKIASLTGDREFIGQEWMAYLAARKIPFTLRLRNRSEEDHPLEIRFQLTDREGEELQMGQETDVVPAGTTWEKQLSVPVPQSGLYTLLVTVQSGETTLERSLDFAVEGGEKEQG